MVRIWLRPGDRVASGAGEVEVLAVGDVVALAVAFPSGGAPRQERLDRGALRLLLPGLQVEFIRPAAHGNDAQRAGQFFFQDDARLSCAIKARRRARPA